MRKASAVTTLIGAKTTTYKGRDIATLGQRVSIPIVKVS